MSSNKHECTSSDSDRQPGTGGGSQHASTSSEADQANTGAARDEFAPDFAGQPTGSEIESLAGFDPSRALTEGLPFQVVDESLSELQPAESAAYMSAESVCGADDRVRVSPATTIPWRWICQLVITMPNGAGFRGTGWFIGPRCVMTAGHCVFSRANGGWARRIEVIPGMDAAARPYGSAVGTSFRSVTGWTTSTDQNFDYGCIILPTNLGNTTGYFGFANLSDASLNGLLLNNSGYPGDKPFGTQWFNAGRVSQVTSRKLYYMLDTYGGQSGSPVWRSLNGARHAVGVHAYGGCPNSATRINGDVYSNMLAWRAI